MEIFCKKTHHTHKQTETNTMAFNFTAFTYIIALIGDAFLIFFAIFHVIAFDELKTDYKNPIDQCNSLNPVSFSNVYNLGFRKNVIHTKMCFNEMLIFLAGIAGIFAAHLFEFIIFSVW